MITIKKVVAEILVALYGIFVDMLCAIVGASLTVYLIYWCVKFMIYIGPTIFRVFDFIVKHVPH